MGADTSVAMANWQRIKFFMEISHFLGAFQVFLFACEAERSNKPLNSVEHARYISRRITLRVLLVFFHTRGIAEAFIHNVNVEVRHFFGRFKRFFISKTFISG